MISTEIYELLVNKIPKENILQNEPMKKHTSFKIGGEAEFFIKTKKIEEIKDILNICNVKNVPLTIIGNGSNLLVKDNGISGIVLKIDIDNIETKNIENTENKNIEDSEIKSTNNIEIKKTDKIQKMENIIINNKNRIEFENANDNNNLVMVTVGAGVQLGKLAQVLLKKSISGFEFASGIPGTIGGAIRMNAGAYGSEFKDIVTETTCMNIDGKVFKLNNKEQEFEYRKSIFKNKKYIILESKLLLKYVEDSKIIKEKMEEYKKSRIEKQPIEFPSAGSTFKRGQDFITAKLIDECGLKGYNVGGAQVATKHAGFIINTGNATADDVLKLVEIVKKNVLDKFGKNIELEIEVVGN